MGTVRRRDEDETRKQRSGEECEEKRGRLKEVGISMVFFFFVSFNINYIF
jgi:hypothetical protein